MLKKVYRFAKKQSRIYSKLMTLILSIAIVFTGIPQSRVFANNGNNGPVDNIELEEGNARVIKTAEPVPGSINKWKIKVRVEYKDLNVPTDVLISVDRSGSMAGDRMSDAKATVNALLDKILYAGSSHKIALHSYSYGYLAGNYSNSWKKHTGFETNKQILSDEVNAMSAGGGTFTQMALHKANLEMATAKAEDTENIRNRAIILITDGRPTAGYKVDMDKLSQELGGLSNAFDWKTGIISDSDYDHSRDSVQNASDGSTTVPTKVTQNGKSYYKGANLQKLGTTYAPRNALVSNGNIPASTFIYTDDDPNTAAGRSNIINRIGWGYDSKYAVHGIDQQGRHMYWDIAENTAIEANEIKKSGNFSRLYIVGLETDDDTNAYLDRMATEGDFYPTTLANLSNTIDSIYADMELHTTSDAILKDIMTEGFKEPEDINVTGGTATYKAPNLELGETNGHIEWDIGTPSQIVDKNEYPHTRYEELTYTLTVEEGWEKSVSETFKTNGKTEVVIDIFNANNEKIGETSAEAVSPEVDPTKYTVEKDLKGFDGGEAQLADESFTITVTGPEGSSYKKDIVLKSGGKSVVGDLTTAGKYTISESIGSGDYDKTFKIFVGDSETGVETDSFTVQPDGSVKISGGKLQDDYTLNDIRIVVTNKEKIAKIGDYVWNDINNDGIQDSEESPQKGVTVRLLDKNGNPVKDQEGKDITAITGEDGKYYFEVAPGSYKVSIDVPSGYSLSNGQQEISDQIKLASGQQNLDADFGLIMKTYKVTHEFVSGTEGKELPDKVKALLPENQTDIANGTDVTPTAPSQPTVDVDGGTWTFDSYDKDSVTINNSDEKFVGTWKFAKPQPKTGNVYVKYVAEDGTVLKDAVAVKENAPEGEDYTTEQKEFDGYVFLKMGEGSAAANGNVVEGDLYVTYVYRLEEKPELKTGNVYVKYVAEDGIVLEDTAVVKENASEGEAYTTEQKEFDGYTFIRMGEDSAAANGTVVEGDLYVTYVYKPTKLPQAPEKPTDPEDPEKPDNQEEIEVSEETSTKGPKTGDESMLSLYAIITLLSGSLLTVLGLRRRKNHF
ncbi:MAG TPA: VWA domain-containing protein [Mogibacterium sp.]|nr:VWA domain-containing protein [Mogibacterium sp.]